MNFLTQILQTLIAPFQFLLRLPQLILISPRAMMGLSFPVRAAVLVFVTMLVAILLSLAAYRFVFHGVLEARYVLTGWAAMVALAAVLAVTVYVFLVFSVPAVSPHADLDEAWQAGMDALREQNLDLNELPLVLVLGADNDLADRMLRATQLPLSVQSVPNGDRPLRWFAGSDAIYLVVSGASCLSRFHQVVLHGGPGSSGHDLHRTLVPGSITESDGGAALGGGPPAGAAALRGTMLAENNPAPAATAAAIPSKPRSISALPRDELELAVDRLAYVCHLLVQHRQPLCALNGVLVTFPYPIVCDAVASRGIPSSVRRDLYEIQSRTQLHFPTIALVTQVESEPGFSELLRRVGQPFVKEQRFGKGMSVITPATLENLEALAWQAAGSFEDWVYQLFAKEDGLHRPGNSKLFTLLCAIRSQVLDSLRSILGNGFSSEQLTGGDPHTPEVFVGGCYFAATGRGDEAQAFVKSVFQKIQELHSDLEWTPDAVIQDGRYHTAAQILTFLNGLLILAVVLLLVAAWRIPSAG